MSIDIPLIAAESAKMLGGAFVGALCTAAYAKYVRVKKFVLHVDEVSGGSIGLPNTPFDFKVLFNGQQYESLNVSVFSIKNAGTDCIEDFDILISSKANDQADWYVDCGLVNDAAHPKKSAETDEAPFLRVKFDHLNPSESDSFVLVSKVQCEFSVSCRKPNVRLVNLKARRAEIQSLASKLIRITQPFGIR